MSLDKNKSVNDKDFRGIWDQCVLTISGSYPAEKPDPDRIFFIKPNMYTTKIPGPETLREAAKKRYFFTGPATKAPRAKWPQIFFKNFFRASKNGLFS